MDAESSKKGLGFEQTSSNLIRTAGAVEQKVGKHFISPVKKGDSAVVVKRTKVRSDCDKESVAVGWINKDSAVLVFEVDCASRMNEVPRAKVSAFDFVCDDILVFVVVAMS